MSLAIAPFDPQDLGELLATGGEMFAGARSLLAQPGYGHMLKASGPCWSAFDYLGRIVGCGGLAIEHPGCSVAWTLLHPELSGRNMLGLHRHAVRMLAECPARRVQADCDPTFEPARRWLALLGFQQEGVRRAYSPDGRDMALFSKVTSG